MKSPHAFILGVGLSLSLAGPFLWYAHANPKIVTVERLVQIPNPEGYCPPCNPVVEYRTKPGACKGTATKARNRGYEAGYAQGREDWRCGR